MDRHRHLQTLGFAHIIHTSYLTVRDLVECGDEVVIAHDGQAHEHVDGEQDVEDDGAVASLSLVEHRRRELEDGGWDAGLVAVHRGHLLVGAVLVGRGCFVEEVPAWNGCVRL